MIKVIMENEKVCQEPWVGEVYNSNPAFMKDHMNLTYLDQGSINQEAQVMAHDGFFRWPIVYSSRGPIGFIDLDLGQSTYLSLVILHKKEHKKGKGKAAFLLLEEMLRQKGVREIRIDVHRDGRCGLMKFWSDLGFKDQGPVTLTWQGHTFEAVKMIKRI